MLPEPISKNNTTAFKGIFAALIVLHHLAVAFKEVIPEKINLLQYIAFPIVGAFMFFSGYGLTYGLLRKPDYLKGFLKKRLVSVGLPFVIAAGLATLLFSLSHHRFVNGFSISAVVQYWFVYVILAYYLLFWLVFRITSVKTGAAVVLLLSVVYVVLSLLLNPVREEMYASALAFPAGVYYQLYEKLADRFLFGRHKNVRQACFFAAFIAAFCARLLIAYRGYQNPVFHTVARNGISLLFLVCVIYLIKQTNIQSRLLMWMGERSYEIYILHPVMLILSTDMLSPVTVRNCAVSAAATLAFTGIGAFLLHKATTLIRQRGGFHGKKA